MSETIARHRANRLYMSAQALADDITTHCAEQDQDDLKRRLAGLWVDAVVSMRTRLDLPAEH